MFIQSRIIHQLRHFTKNFKERVKHTWIFFSFISIRNCFFDHARTFGFLNMSKMFIMGFSLCDIGVCLCQRKWTLDDDWMEHASTICLPNAWVFTLQIEIHFFIYLLSHQCMELFRNFQMFVANGWICVMLKKHTSRTNLCERVKYSTWKNKSNLKKIHSDISSSLLDESFIDFLGRLETRFVWMFLANGMIFSLAGIEWKRKMLNEKIKEWIYGNF